MKIEKKHIIIAIVVAVAVYLLWKRGVFAKGTDPGDDGTGGNGGSPTTSSPASLDYILTHVRFNDAERERISAVYSRAMTDKSYQQSLQASANAKGYSFDQMVVLKDLWALYHPANASEPWTNDRGWQLQQEVLQLNGQSLW